MTAADHGRSGGRVRAVASAVLRTDPSAAGTEVAALAVRIALVWIFFYYGAGKLFGAFDGPGIHRTAEFMADTAHLRPGAFFAVLGGVIEFGGALALAFGLVTRLAGLALLGDQVVAMVTVSWVHGINSLSATPGYEFNLALAAMALVVVGIGPGRFSVDAVVARHLTPPGAPPSDRPPGAAPTGTWPPATPRPTVATDQGGAG
jgi:putative oxidoreductase